jgi:hypothetical protein
MKEHLLEYLLLAMALLSFLSSVHKAETGLPLSLAAYLVWRLQKVGGPQQSLKLTFFVLLAFSVAVDLLWFANWQSIYGLAASDSSPGDTADTEAESHYHKFVLVNSLILVLLKVAASN